MEENVKTNYFDSSSYYYSDIVFKRIGHSFSPRYKTRKCHRRVFTEKTMTIPDQSYTIRELFERSAVNSMPGGLERRVFYDDEKDINKLFARSGIDLSTLDLVELQEYKEQLDDKIRDAKASLQQKKTEVSATSE